MDTGWRFRKSGFERDFAIASRENGDAIWRCDMEIQEEIYYHSSSFETTRLND